MKKEACNSQPRAAGESATRHQVSALLDRHYHKTANNQKKSAVNMYHCLHIPKIKIKENSIKLKYSSYYKYSNYNFNSLSASCIAPILIKQFKFPQLKNVENKVLENFKVFKIKNDSGKISSRSGTSSSLRPSPD